MEINRDCFNSEIFNLSMGNIVLSEADHSLSDTDVINLKDKAKENGFEHLSVKICTSNKQCINPFFRQGFYLTDTLLEYKYTYKNELPEDFPHKTIIRDYTEKDINELMRISKKSFEYDRFHSDPFLDNNLCDKYYEQWIYNSCHGFADKVIVSEHEGKAVGFTTGKADHNQEYGRLVLSAVSDQYRGLGIYTSMIYEGMKWLQKEGFAGLFVGTQINNIAVQKAWIKLGFTVSTSEYVLHSKL